MLSIGRFVRYDNPMGGRVMQQVRESGSEGSASGSSPAVPSSSSSSRRSSQPVPSPSNQPPLEPVMSQSTFLLGSLSVFALSLLLGVRRAVKQEKQSMKAVVSDIQGMHLGARAFFWGTCLCFGTAIGAGTLFAYTTGIRDAQTFGRVAKEKIAALGIIPPLKPETDDEREEREQLERDAAVAYDEIFGDDSEEEKERKAKMTWEDKLARVWDLKKIVEKALGGKNTPPEEGEEEKKQEVKEQPVYSEDKPKWRQKLERIFGLSK